MQLQKTINLQPENNEKGFSQERKELIIKDFIFTAHMLGFRDVLTNCFRDKEQSFGEAIQEVNGSMTCGVFTNTIILEKVRRLGIPLENVLGFILPR